MTQPQLAISTPNGRMYVHPNHGKQVPSITNVIGMIEKPALKYWSAKQVAIAAAEGLDILNKMKTQEERVDYLKGAPFRKTGEASKVGDTVHQWIDFYAQNYIRTGGSRDWVPEDLAAASLTARRMWTQFKHMDSHYQVEWLVTEFTVWSEKHNYAGTGDWIARIGKSVIYGDTKTGNGIYPEVGLQISAIAGSDYAIDGDGRQYELPKADRFAALHVRPTYTRLSPLNEIPECFKAFLGARAVFEWKCTMADRVIGESPQLKGPR